MPAPTPRDLATLCATAARGGPPLHPATGPEAIADQHAREVAAYIGRHPAAAADEIGAALALPRWNVERALAALRGEPVPYRARPIYRTAGRARGGRPPGAQGKERAA